MWGREGGKCRGKMCLQGRYVLSSKILKYTHPKMIDSKSVIYDAIITVTNVNEPFRELIMQPLPGRPPTPLIVLAP